MPLVDCEPDHAPLAVHDVALVDDQVNVELAPRRMDVGLTEIVTVGAGGVPTVTAADAFAFPPGPEHVSV